MVYIRRGLGGFLLVLGVPGLLLPVLQGVLFIVLGLYLLSLDSRWFRKKLAGWTRRNHHVSKLHSMIDTRIRQAFNIPNNDHY